jgi:SAM-dependent methyltransferase
MTTFTQDPALEAYESLAPFYDSYTGRERYEEWLPTLEEIALEHGLAGSRVLDVGCGTGKSFLPLAARGYEVTAFDISPSMVERARESAEGTGAEVVVADVRELPLLGRFDLATSLNDSLNYMLTPEELLAAFEGIARNLRPGGLLVFDLGSLHSYRHHFGRDMAGDADDRTFFCWRGKTPVDAPPGVLASSVLEVFASADGESWQRTSSRHLCRHHPPELVERLLGEAGLDLLELRGQISATCIEPVADDNRHLKLVYFARRATSARTDRSRRGVITR